MKLDIDYNFILLGINTSLECYRLAFYLNEKLNLNFERTTTDVVVYSETNYIISQHTLYQYIDEENLIDWNLLQNKNFKNKFVENVKLPDLGLFNYNQSNPVLYLLPELKNVQFLLQIDSDISSVNLKLLLRKIRQITDVSSAFFIEYNTLRSKRNLII